MGPLPRDAHRGEQARAVRAMSEAFHSCPEVAAGLERLVGDVLGVRASHVGHEVIVPPRLNLAAYLSRRRVHARHRLRLHTPAALPWTRGAAIDHVDLFAKARRRPAAAPIEHALNDTPHPDFRAPYFIGTVEHDGLAIGVWEHVEGEVVRLPDLPLEQQMRFARAVAAINALPGTDLKPRTRWTQEPITRYREFFAALPGDEGAAWRGPLDRLERLYARDDFEAASRLEGDPVPAHNDFNESNIFARPDGLVVFDWEGASLNAPAADLRIILGRRPDHSDLLLGEYVSRAGELGLRVGLDQAKRNCELIEGFRLVFKGWERQNLKMVLRGLDHVEPHFARGAARANTGR